MNIIEHELKRFDLWQEELQKKKAAYILHKESARGKPAFTKWKGFMFSECMQSVSE